MKEAPLHNDIAFGPKGGAAHWLKTADGLRIRVAHWTGPDVKGTVLLFPGRTEYIEKYGDAAKEFLARDYATVAIDWRGQGLADRMIPDARIGYVKQFADYQHDVAATLDYVRALGLPEPYYLVGHSMGGCIGLRTLMNDFPVKAAAFSAPMWGIGIASWLRPFAWGLSLASRQIGRSDSIAPMQSPETYVLRETFDLNTLTRDKKMWELLQTQMKVRPELALGGPSLHWLYEALVETRSLAAMPSPKIPCITFLGSAESIVDTDRIKDRMARWPDGMLTMLPGGEHEVMLEIPATRQKVFDDMAAHFAAHH